MIAYGRRTEVPYVPTPEVATELTMTDVYARGLLHVLGAETTAHFAFTESTPGQSGRLAHDASVLPYFNAVRSEDDWTVQAYLSPPRDRSTLIMTAAEFTLTPCDLVLQRLCRDVYVCLDSRGQAPPVKQMNSLALRAPTALRALNDALETLIRSQVELRPYWRVDELEQ
jgi:hypothetical protein